MKEHEDFLVEIHTEELPPKSLLKLAEAFSQAIVERLQKADLVFEEAKYFATPRRLAVLIKNLVAAQPDQEVERKGPALQAAFSADGKPTQACIGFARSCGVTPEELMTIKNSQGEWVGFRQQVAGKNVKELLPGIVEQATAALPIPKRMRWGSNEAQFVRPVHSVIMLYGDEVIPANILGCEANRVTRGHRFLAPDWITIPHPATYASILETEGFVIADFSTRREKIKKEAQVCLQKHLPLEKDASVLISSENFLNEVTGLVEWPVALCGRFDDAFLSVPGEVLISSMEDHQRYFPVVNKNGKLLPYFITMSNIPSQDPERVIHGNERVLRARLSDAAFFYTTDQKVRLEERIERLKNIVFQAKLGSLYDKSERLSHLAAFIAEKMHANTQHALRAGILAKTDLTTDMVGEFPELQGVMGEYYALHDGEPNDIAMALKEQYLPRFAGDCLPTTKIGQSLAIADKLDTLLGIFSINQIPTGDKDPYGLRRAAVGILRILIENEINLDLKEALIVASQSYGLVNADAVIVQVLNFMQERLKAWYLDQKISSDVFMAVAAVSPEGITNPLDAHKRIQAVQAFKKLNEAETLSIANKRVSNILAKYTDTIDAQAIDATFFENPAEAELATQLEAKKENVMRLYEAHQYDQVLLQLAELRKPIDDFFDQVMVMTDDKARRENRILLLRKLRMLFSQVADIALLQ